jgi:hypothetical protein
MNNYGPKSQIAEAATFSARSVIWGRGEAYHDLISERTQALRIPHFLPRTAGKPPFISFSRPWRTVATLISSDALAVAILGYGSTGKLVLKKLRENPGIGLRPIAVPDDNPVKLDDVGEGLVRGPLSRCMYGECFRRLLVIPNVIGMTSLGISARNTGGIVGLAITLLLAPVVLPVRSSINVPASAGAGRASMSGSHRQDHPENQYRRASAVLERSRRRDERGSPRHYGPVAGFRTQSSAVQRTAAVTGPGATDPRTQRSNTSEVNVSASSCSPAKRANACSWYSGPRRSKPMARRETAQPSELDLGVDGGGVETAMSQDVGNLRAAACRTTTHKHGAAGLAQYLRTEDATTCVPPG